MQLSLAIPAPYHHQMRERGEAVRELPISDFAYTIPSSYKHLILFIHLPHARIILHLTTIAETKDTYCLAYPTRRSVYGYDSGNGLLHLRKGRGMIVLEGGE